MSETKKVYQAISNVMRDIGESGIAKARNNQQQGYKFRGIDDVYNALSPILAKHGLMMLPRVLNRECVERRTAKDTPLFYTILDVEFDIVCADDGSIHTVRVVGEAMDTADKSSNKSMSAAYKYACMQVFCIPTEGDNDADSTTHEVKATEPAKAKAKPTAEATWVKEHLSEAQFKEFQTTCKTHDASWTEKVAAAMKEGVDDYDGLVVFSFSKQG